MAWKYKLSFLFLLTCSSSVNSQVKNGRNAREGEIPYQVSVKYERGRIFGWTRNFVFPQRPFNDNVLCGGTLLNALWVMSAAHCLDVENNFIDEYRVTAGSIYAARRPNEAHRRSAVSRTFYVHEGYRENDKTMWTESRHDIGLLFLDTPIEYSDRVQPAVLSHANSDPRKGWNCRYSGWGICGQRVVNGELENSYEDILKVAEDSSIINNKHCIKYSEYNKKNYENLICFADVSRDVFFNRKRTENECQSCCRGDSGGPVACRESKQDEFGSVVHGVISFGETVFRTAGQKKTPDAAVKPSSFVNWIDEKVRSKTKNLIIRQQGSDAERGSAPYHVSIEGKYSNRNDVMIICQGAILSKRWILTAASCVDNNPLQHTKGPQRGELNLGVDPQELQSVTVKAGLHENRLQEKTTHEWYQHRLYDKNIDKYDIHNVALIFLRTDLDFETEYVKPIRLIAAKRAKKCKVLGWEYDYETESDSYENPLQVRQVKILDDKKCSSPVLKPRALQSFLGYQICTKQEDGKPTISVEAGTSLVCKDPIRGDEGVFGVASFGGYWERVGGGAGPKVFTRIEPNLDWITSKQAEIETLYGFRE